MYCIIRTSAIYGYGVDKKNFGIIVLEKLMRSEEVRAFGDQFVSSTYNKVLAKALLDIAERNIRGFCM